MTDSKELPPNRSRRARSIAAAAVVLIIAGACGAGWWLIRMPSDPAAQPDQAKSPAPAPKAQPSPPVSEPVGKIIALADQNGREGTLTSAVNEIGVSLSEEETGQVAEFVRAATERDAPHNVTAVDLNSLMNLLRANGYADPGFFEFLAGVFRDQTQDIEVRDYALQHSAAWLRSRDRATASPAVDDPDVRAGVYSLLFEAAQQTDQSFSGTAASALADLAVFHPEEIDQDRLDRLIMKLVGDPAVHASTRITAMQLAGEREILQVTDTVRGIAADQAAGTSLRMSAVAALGMLGDTTDLELLSSMNPLNKRLQLAANGAVSKINARTTPAE